MKVLHLAPDGPSIIDDSKVGDGGEPRVTRLDVDTIQVELVGPGASSSIVPILTMIEAYKKVHGRKDR